jgi:uncharacterized membrane protein
MPEIAMVTRTQRNSEAGLGRRGLSRWTSQLRACPIFAGLLFFLFAGAAPASAQFAVCNQTLDALNLAVATETNGVFNSEGWWTIGANRCVDVIKDELVSRYIYVYATDVFGQPILASSVAGENMCVGAKRFTINGTDSCWERGYQSVHFMEVDTQQMARWTLFLKEPAPG